MIKKMMHLYVCKKFSVYGISTKNKFGYYYWWDYNDLICERINEVMTIYDNNKILELLKNKFKK